MQRAGLDFELEGGPGPHGAEISDGMFLTQMGIGGYDALDNFGVTQTDQVRCRCHYPSPRPIFSRPSLAWLFFLSPPFPLPPPSTFFFRREWRQRQGSGREY